MPNSRAALSRDLIRLIRIPSVTSDSNRRSARLTADIFRRAGLKVLIQSTRRSGQIFYNVAGQKGGRGRPLMLCAHLDTVPPGDLASWTKTGGNPWKAVRSGHKLYGLGSADDKASLAAMAHAASRVEARELRRPLVVLATFGEESGMGGAWLFRKAWRGPKPFAAFVGEPTALTLTYRHKGMGVVELEIHPPSRLAGAKGGARKVFTGKQGHSSRPWLGTNALEKAMAYLRSPGARSKSVVCIEGGAAANLIPGRAEVVLTGPRPRNSAQPALPRCSGYPVPLLTACDDSVKKTLKVYSRRRDASFRPARITSNFGVVRTERDHIRMVYDFRLLPGQSVADIERLIRKEVKKIPRAFPGFRVTTRIERSNPPLGGSARGPLVRFALAALKRAGHRAALVTKPSCTEAGVYERWGIPAVIFGPGKAPGNIHAPNESVDLREVAKAAALYEAIIRAACTGDAPCF